MTADTRRKAIIELICMCRHTTREYLAFEFKVSKRTIDYDIVKLSDDYPIYTIPGNGGGIHIIDGYYLGRMYFTQKQSSTLENIAKNLEGEELKIVQGILRNFTKPTHKKGNETKRKCIKITT